ncbi:MAG: hypothetical protein M3040_10685, partial [Bacteroidota bacterium]|nr:hypothetical protein [Bacteroidota bacterium]
MRLAILAALLGIVGTFSIVAYLHRNQDKENKSTIVENKPLAATKTVETVGLDTTKQPKLKIEQPSTPLLPAEDSTAVIEKEDTATKAATELTKTEKKLVDTVPMRPQKPVLATKKAIRNQLVKPTAASNKIKARLFSRQELQKVVARLIRAKEKNRLKSNCVQIFSTKETTDTKRM